jgi:serine/threonine protein kinase
MFTTNDLSKNEILGKGGYGTVFEGVWCDKPAAIKRIELINISGKEERKNRREEEAMLKLDHPNVIKLLHVESDSTFR